MSGLLRDLVNGHWARRRSLSTMYLETIRGRQILFESVASGIFTRNRVFRTTMVIDETTEPTASHDDFAAYRSAMALSLLKNLPED